MCPPNSVPRFEAMLAGKHRLCLRTGLLLIRIHDLADLVEPNHLAVWGHELPPGPIASRFQGRSGFDHIRDQPWSGSVVRHRFPFRIDPRLGWCPRTCGVAEDLKARQELRLNLSRGWLAARKAGKLYGGLHIALVARKVWDGSSRNRRKLDAGLYISLVASKARDRAGRDGRKVQHRDRHAKGP
jgi:hypothetical protein